MGARPPSGLPPAGRHAAPGAVMVVGGALVLLLPASLVDDRALGIDADAPR
ncbi:hypothetical protein ACFFTK_11410 [Pseudonocardia petroleophila]|uniref:Uncharacterized protein n=1 Tax=Pseudonocardia petroleophila TaxID=37331 RepID=A0A7G7MFB4_9PSEU|nr:hypothetical protein [Pseudonocardia petroleophila]QNG51475.1 hypothetical protein H6H00_25650 [Pseudonocardia petroleophila]